MTKKFDLLRLENLLRPAFVVLFLITGFLHASNLTFGKPVISFFQWPALALGGIVLILRLCRVRRFLGDKILWILTAFLASFLLSSLLSRGAGLYENLRSFVFLVLQTGVLYACPDDAQGIDAREREWRVYAAVFMIGAFVISFIGIVFLYAGVKEVIPQKAGPTVCVGFVWGRLFGAWWDPNIGAVTAAFSFLFSLYFFFRTKRILLRVLLVLSAFVQLFEVILSDSRSGQLVLAVSLGVYGYFGVRKFFKPRMKKRFWRIALCVLIMLVFAAGVFFLTRALETVFVDLFLPESEVFGREQDLVNDITNRRTQIWKSAAEIWREKPFFGTSRAGILPFAEENLPQTYIVNNDHMKFSSMHNLFFDVLVSQGALGASIFLVFVAACLAAFIRKGKRIFDGHESAVMFSLTVTLVLISMVMTEIFYVISPVSTLAWLSLSILMQKGRKKE